MMPPQCLLFFGTNPASIIDQWFKSLEILKAIQSSYSLSMSFPLLKESFKYDSWCLLVVQSRLNLQSVAWISLLLQNNVESVSDWIWDSSFLQHAVTFAAGLACEGMIPFCAIYSSFLQRGYDQIVHDVCLQSLPVRFAMDRAGLVGADGATHCGFADIAYMSCVPNMVVMAVSTF